MHREIKSFLFSQALADGVRITFAIIVPVLILRHFGYFELGLAISGGALCVNITDLPGPFRHRRNGLFAASVLLTVFSFLAALAHHSLPGLAILLTTCTFLFSMLAVYGVRAATVGSATLLVMIIGLSSTLHNIQQILLHSILILTGALWYTILSLATGIIRPYRMPQRNLGNCIQETANYLSIKAGFFNAEVDLRKQYDKLFSQQVKVAEKQENMRELLFKTRQVVRDTSGTGRALMLTFTALVDLFEHINVSAYDYRELRRRLGEGAGDKAALAKVKQTAHLLAIMLHDIGTAVQTNRHYIREDKNIEQQISQIRELSPGSADPALLLSIAQNLEDIYLMACKISEFLKEDFSGEGRKIPHNQFINHQSADIRLLMENMTMTSSIFRHSLRVSIATLAGLLLAHYLNFGAHSYWILLTIAFIMKPAYSLTRSRNIQRLAGTAAGVVIGVAILYLEPPAVLKFSLMVFFMIGTYSFMRLNYITMVIMTTPFVLLLSNLLGTGTWDVVTERLLDTFLGCLVAYAASYLLWPSWEADQLRSVISKAVDASRHYALSIHNLSKNPRDLLPYKIARREVYISTANLSSAFQRMLSEPENKQAHAAEIFEFVVLNYTLTSNFGSFASAILAGDRLKESTLKKIEEATAILTSSDPRHKAPQDADPLLGISFDFREKGKLLAGLITQ